MPPWASGREGEDESEERHRLLKEEDEAELPEPDDQPIHEFELDGHVEETASASQNGHFQLNTTSNKTSSNRITNTDRLRFLLLLPVAYATQSFQSLVSNVRHAPTASRSLGFFGTLRTVFNYPEPGIELRSTAWLDGLRGLAAFEVFVFHYVDFWINRAVDFGSGEHSRLEWYYAPFIRTLYASGDAAVCLFFGISGYVLTHRFLKLMRERKQEELLTALSSAVFRRAIRLYLPTVLETFILMVLCRYTYLPRPAPYEPEPTLYLEVRTWYIEMLHLILPLRYPDRFDQLHDRYDGGISWTIPLEYYGSIYVYTAILFLSQLRNINVRRALCGVMVCISIAKDDWIAAQFVMGMAFADYQLERHAQQQSQPSKLPWLRRLFFIALFLFGFHFSGLPGARYQRIDDVEVEILEPRWTYDWVAIPVWWFGLYRERQADRYILCFATMASLVGIGETRALRRILETRPVQYLGRISFGLYLCHIFVRAWLEPLRYGVISLVGLDTNVGYFSWTDYGQIRVAYILFMIPAMVVNFIVAGLFERYLDRPSVQAGKTFEKWCLSWKEKSPESPPLQMHDVRRDRAGQVPE